MLLLFDDGYYLIDRRRGFFVFEHVLICKCEQFQMFCQLTYPPMAKQCLLELRPDMVSSREFTEIPQFEKRHSFSEVYEFLVMPLYIFGVIL